MGKLSDIVFSPAVTKEFNIANHKVVMRELNTEDNLRMNVNYDTESTGVKENITNTLEILSYALVSIDGIVPENALEAKNFLVKLTSGHLNEFFKSYQDISSIDSGDTEKK